MSQDPPTSRADVEQPQRLLPAALAALARGLAHPTAMRTTDEAVIAAIYAERITQGLTSDEARAIEAITNRREHGLALCRAGQIREGRSMIAQARLMLARANLGREAFVLSDSFLCAAEGFVHYKSNRADAATTSMINAIDRCRELHDVFGYPVEGRRIHLACNAARIGIEAARQTESAIVATQLLNLIATSDRRFWPYPDLEYFGEPDLLDDGVRWELMDQALAVVGRLDREALGSVAAGFPDPPKTEKRPLTALAQCFVHAIRAHSSGDMETFLTHCIAFFPAGAEHLPRAFGRLVKLFAAAQATTRRKPVGAREL